MNGYFFNAEPTADLEKHPTGYDREYDADSHAAFFEPLFAAAGVLWAEGEPCQVYNRGGGTLGVKAGAAYVKGRMVLFDGSETLTAKTGHVVARMNKAVEVRAFELLIVDAPVQGDGDIYDLPLAKVAVSGSSVAITDERVYLSARIMGGHTHDAGDIKTGVFDPARVPYIPDWSKVSAEYQVLDLEQAITCGPSSTAVHPFTIPFPAPLAKRPKRVVVRIGNRFDNWAHSGPSSNRPNFLVLDMTYDDNNKLWTYISAIHRESSSGDDGSYPGMWVTLPLRPGEGSSRLISYSGEPTGTRNWSGFGGNAFYQSNVKPGASDDNTKLMRFLIGNFAFDEVGIHFKIHEEALPSDRATSTGTLQFRARIFVFE